MFNHEDRQRLIRAENELSHIRAMLVSVLSNQNLGAERMTALSDAIAKLQADVTAESSVVDSAEALLQGLKAALDKAIADAAAAGVSPADLQALSDLSASVGSKTGELAAAVTANTPSA